MPVHSLNLIIIIIVNVITHKHNAARATCFSPDAAGSFAGERVTRIRANVHVHDLHDYVAALWHKMTLVALRLARARLMALAIA